MSTTTDSNISSYGTSYHTVNPYEDYPSDVFDVEVYSGSTSSSASSLASAYLAELEAQKEAQAEAIMEKYAIASASAYDDKNDAISLAKQEYLRNINPYGVQSEALSAYGFDSSGGYALSNKQASYAEYVNSQNVANALYEDTMTDLKIAEIDDQIANDYYYQDAETVFASNAEKIYAEMESSSSSGYSAEQQENLLAALEFVETLYNVSPSKVSLTNEDLVDYLERVYGVEGDDFEFVVSSVSNILSAYGYVPYEFWDSSLYGN